MNPVWFSQATALADALMTRELALTEMQPGATLIDLSHQSEGVSLEILSKVTKGLGPALYLNRDLLLIVTTGKIDTTLAAKTIAEAMEPEVRKSIRLGHITGESIIDRIEEFASEGIGLCNQSGEPMIDQPNAPDSVFAQCPASSISDIIVEGAQVVLSHTAAPGTIALGAYGAINRMELTQVNPENAASVASAGKAIFSSTSSESESPKRFVQASIDANGFVRLLNTTPDPFVVEEDLPDLSYQVSWESKEQGMHIESLKAKVRTDGLPINATFTDGYKLSCLIRAKEDQQLVLKSHLSKFPTIKAVESGPNLVEISTTGEKEKLSALASRMELLLYELGMKYDPSPLSNAIQPIVKEWKSFVPREKVLFGQECQYLSGWLSN